MTNAVESLFDTVLASLPAEERYEKHTIDPEKDRDDDWLDEPPDSSTSDDILTTLDEERLVRRATDALDDYRRDSERLPSDIREVFEGGIRRRGFDVLAFYKSRRLIAQRPYVGRWGIFYLKHGVTFLANEIERTYPGYSDPRLLAYEFLREHERFHFKADLQTLMLEAVTGRHLHGPRRQAFKGRRSTFVEEALANRQAWDWSKKRSNAIEDFAFNFMKLQPGAYSRFDEPRLSLAAEWSANVLDGNVTQGATRYDFAHWVETLPTGLQRASLCPEYFVRPAALANWLPSALVLPPVITVTDDAEVTKRLSMRFINLRDQWTRTKEKLIESRLLRGLNFKPWPNDGKACYSVRVDDNFRAHLKHEGGGNWIAYIIGSHKELGHG
jgi:hypothetical protein